VRELAPGRDGEAVRARVQRVDVEAVGGDDRDRNEEEDAEPGDLDAVEAVAGEERAVEVAE